MRRAAFTFFVVVNAHRYFIAGEPVPTPKPYALAGTVASTIPANTFYFTDVVEFEKHFRLQLPGSTYAAIDEEHSVHKVRPYAEWLEKITYDRWAPGGYQTLSHMKTLEVPQIGRGFEATHPYTVSPDYSTQTLVTGVTWSSTPRIPYQSFWSATFSYRVPPPKLTTSVPERLLVDKTEAEASRLKGELPIKRVIKRLNEDVELLEKEIARWERAFDEVESDAGSSTTPEPAGHMAPTALTTPAPKAADESTSFVLTRAEDSTYRTLNMEALWPKVKRAHHRTEQLSEGKKLFLNDLVALHPLPREEETWAERATTSNSHNVQQLKTETFSVSTLHPVWAVRLPQPRKTGLAQLRVIAPRSATPPVSKQENSDIDTLDNVALGGVWGSAQHSAVSETDATIGNAQIEHVSTVPRPLETTRHPTAPFMNHARLRFHHQRKKL